MKYLIGMGNYAMGDDGTYKGTYIGMIDHNFTAIARGLAPDPCFAG